MPLFFRPGKSTAITLIRHRLSRLICSVSNRADQMVPWACCSYIFMSWSLTPPPLKGWPLTCTLWDINGIWKRAEGEASHQARQPPTYSPMGERPTPLREGIRHHSEAELERRAFTWVPRLWRAVVSGSEHLPEPPAVLYTEGRWTGVWRQSQGLRRMMSAMLKSLAVTSDLPVAGFHEHAQPRGTVGGIISQREW